MPNDQSEDFGRKSSFSNVTEQVSDRVTQIGNRVSDAARTAADTIDDKREATADGLASAASAVRARAGRLPGGERVTDAARAAADKLSATADYVRQHDTRQMTTDLQTLVKRNPGPALVIAAAIGFVVGRAFSRD